MKRRAWIIAVIVVAALMIVGGSFYTVQENEYAAVLQFGKITRVDDTAGFKFKTPFVQTVTKVPKETQVYDIAPSDVITKDKKSMIADDYILWKVTDAKKFVQSLNGSISGAQDRTAVTVYNATKSIVSSMTQDELIAARGSSLTTQITAASNSDIGEYGLTIIKAEIKAMDLPDDNKEAVYERMISERNNIAAAYKAEGEAEAQKIKNQTDKEVAVKKADAQKQAQILEAEGEQTYMQTLQDAYNTQEKADFYNYIRGLDALKASLTGGDKTIILDKNSELARVLYGTEE